MKTLADDEWWVVCRLQVGLGVDDESQRVVPDFGTRWGCCGVDRADGQTGSDEGFERERGGEKRKKIRAELANGKAKQIKQENVSKIGYPKDRRKKNEEKRKKVGGVSHKNALFTVLRFKLGDPLGDPWFCSDLLG